MLRNNDQFSCFIVINDKMYKCKVVVELWMPINFELSTRDYVCFRNNNGGKGKIVKITPK